MSMLWSIKCDADKIQRVFGNLLRNAVIYSFDGTAIDGTDIEIEVVEQGQNIVIRYMNHGDTIPKEKLERLNARETFVPESAWAQI